MDLALEYIENVLSDSCSLDPPIEDPEGCTRVTLGRFEKKQNGVQDGRRFI